MMRDSKVDQNWLRQMMAANPPGPVRNKEGQIIEGSFLTGPVRLSFVYLDKPRPGMKRDDGTMGPARYTVLSLFPPGANVSPMHQAWAAKCAEEFPKNVTNGQVHGLYVPFQDQGAKPQLAGFTPGGVFAEYVANVDHRPQVVDARGNPIVNITERAYSGCWAICSVNLYAFGKNAGPMSKKGCRFGLQAVMVIADDEKLGGGTVDAKTQFAGINITADTNVAASFGGLQPNSVDPVVAKAAAAGVDVDTYRMMYGDAA